MSLDIFVYFTPNNYGPGSCYNFDCNAYFELSSVLPIGVPLDTSTDSNLKSINIAWYRDPGSTTDGNWYLFRRNSDGTFSVAGFYAGGVFGDGSLGLGKWATRVDFGGEVFSKGSSGSWPSLPVVGMGNGRNPAQYWIAGYRAAQDALWWMNPAGTWSDFVPSDFVQTPDDDGPHPGWYPGCAYGMSFGRPGGVPTVSFGGRGYDGSWYNCDKTY